MSDENILELHDMVNVKQTEYTIPKCQSQLLMQLVM